MKAPQPLTALLDSIEGSLCYFYDFAPLARAKDHLVSRQEVEALGLAHQVQGQGTVLCDQRTAPDECFMGIYFHDKIAQQLINAQTTAKLDSQNLNAFCVAVEELSHFHLLLNRMASSQPVSQLELECQAEIDKLLITAHHLHQQYNDPHVHALVFKLYDEAKIIGAEHERYWQATKFAYQFWKAFKKEAFKNKSPLHSPELQRILRESYAQNFSHKLVLLDRIA